MTRALSVLEGALWLSGTALLTVCGTPLIHSGASQIDFGGIASHRGETRLAKEAAQPGDVLGLLRVPELSLTVPIVEDDDHAALLRGVGRMKGSAYPGGLGNLVLAGHRDTYFRPLRRVKAGMTIEVSTNLNRYRYIVDRMEIVGPDAVRVLEIGQQPELTLITCYPFEFIGPAPQRFIVHAHLASDPD